MLYSELSTHKLMSPILLSGFLLSKPLKVTVFNPKIFASLAPLIIFGDLPLLISMARSPVSTYTLKHSTIHFHIRNHLQNM